MFEKANRSQDPKKSITPPGGTFLGMLRILRLRPQNPKDPKKRVTLYFAVSDLVGF